MNQEKIIMDADLVSHFNESWSLEEFMQMCGPKMQIGYYPVTNKGSVTYWRCRFGDTNKTWVYSYVSVRIRAFTPDWVVKNKYLIRIGKTESGDYVLYYNGQHISWTDIDLGFDPTLYTIAVEPDGTNLDFDKFRREHGRFCVIHNYDYKTYFVQFSDRGRYTIIHISKNVIGTRMDEIEHNPDRYKIQVVNSMYWLCLKEEEL